MKKSKSKVNKSTSKVNVKKKNKISFMLVIDYIFLISLALSVLFGIQTNTIFMWPFTIVLIITIICMMIILMNAVYVRIFKKIRNRKAKI